jgi:hypothetical protein
VTIDIPEDSPYFVNTPDSVAVPLGDIVCRETLDPELVEHAHQLMMDAKTGRREKRNRLKS